MAETIVFNRCRRACPGQDRRSGAVDSRANLFGSWQSTLTTVIVGGLLLYFLPKFLNWAVFTATTVANADACRADGV